ncbi:MAG: hypothetical protein VYC39_16385 [Myxococcota bacterium]|nr:hypothetical protein [Myxococcota bacterium]
MNLQLIYIFCILVLMHFILFSFVEWFAHRYLMHRKALPSLLYRARAYFTDVYTNHAILHHRKFYKIYDHELDPIGRELNLRFIWTDYFVTNLIFAPIHSLYIWYLPVGSAALAFMLLCYMFLWNHLHTEMHIPSNRWFFRNSAFRFLNRHHFLHHRHPGRNFNVVIPLADYLFGTAIRASEVEEGIMQQLGLFSDSRGPEIREESIETCRSASTSQS